MKISVLSLGEKAAAAEPGLPIGEREVLRRDSSKAERPVLYPDPEADSDLSPWLPSFSVPAPVGEYVDH